MKKVILYIAQSLDGYVATKDGKVAWLDPFFSDDYGTKEFIVSMDTVIQGKTTYDQFKTKHEGKNNYVFSHNEDLVEDGVTFVNGSPKEFIDNLDEKTHKNIWLVGGPTLFAQFLNEHVVNELIIFTMPVLLNGGVPLFQKIGIAPRLTLTNTEKYKNGVVRSDYIVE